MSIDDAILGALRLDRWTTTTDLHESVQLRVRVTYSNMWQRLRVLEAAKRIERGGLVRRKQFEWRLISVVS